MTRAASHNQMRTTAPKWRQQLGAEGVGIEMGVEGALGLWGQDHS